MSQQDQSPLWWTNANQRLPPGYESNELVRAVAHATVAQQARCGEFDLFNRLEFGHLFAEAIGALGLNTWDCVAEPVLSPNGRMTGIRLYPVTAIDDDGEVVDYLEGVWLALDNTGLILDNDFTTYFSLEID